MSQCLKSEGAVFKKLIDRFLSKGNFEGGKVNVLTAIRIFN